MTKTMSSTTFARNFGEIRDQIRDLGIVRVESHSRLVGGFLSPLELANYERLQQRERKVYKVEDLPPEIVSALEMELARLGA